jgi:membrane protease YdiL (CAAX protease family)
MTSLRSFVALAYLLTWVFLGPFFYLYNVVLHREIPWWLWLMVPFAFVGGYGPSVAALVITYRAEGRRGVRRLLALLAVWRVPFHWYAITLLMPPLLTALSILIVDSGLDTLRQFDPVSVLRGLALIYALALPFGPLGEELGWRGFALPRLLERFRPWLASVIVGCLWTFWHGPMMLFMPGASLPSFMELSVFSVAIYLVQDISQSAFMTLLFLRTRGSVLLAVLAHLAFNTATAVVFAGLPRLSADQVRDIYIMNVAVLSVVGVASLLLAGRSELVRRRPSPAPTLTGGEPSVSGNSALNPPPTAGEL